MPKLILFIFISNFFEFFYSSFQSDWLMAMKYAEKLSLASRWSKATYTYQKACFLLMCEEQSAEIKNHVRHLFMYEVHYLKRHFAFLKIYVHLYLCQ